jgi:hypothetical protein
VTVGGDEGDHSFPLLLETELDALADRLGVPRLSAFYDHSALASEYAEELGEVADAGEPAAATWFDAQACRATVVALLDELRARPETLRFKARSSTSHWPASLLDDLDDLKSGLDEAVARGHKCRLLIVP